MDQRPNILHLSGYHDIYGGKESKFYYNKTEFYKPKIAKEIAEKYGINPDNNYNRFGLKCPEIARGYREKFVCFNCRQYGKTQNASIRRENVHSYQTDYDIKMETYTNPTCSKCHKEKVCVGPKFAPPKQDDIKAWNEAKVKYEKNHKIFQYSYNEFANRTVGWTRKKNSTEWIRKK